MDINPQREEIANGAARMDCDLVGGVGPRAHGKIVSLALPQEIEPQGEPSVVAPWGEPPRGWCARHQAYSPRMSFFT